MLLDGWQLVFAARREVNVTRQNLDAMRDHTPTNLRRVFDSAQPFLIDDTTVAEEWSHVPGFEYIRAWLGVPLMLKGACIGALTIDREQPHSFTAEDVELALAFANQAAVAIDNARLFNEVQTYAERLDARVRERTRELEALYGITAAAIENLDLERVLARALELALSLIHISTAIGAQDRARAAAVALAFILEALKHLKLVVQAIGIAAQGGKLFVALG